MRCVFWWFCQQKQVDFPCNHLNNGVYYIGKNRAYMYINRVFSVNPFVRTCVRNW